VKGTSPLHLQKCQCGFLLLAVEHIFTGTIFNGSQTDFLLAPGKPAAFLFCTADGKTMTVPKVDCQPLHPSGRIPKTDRQKSRTLDAPNVGRLDTFQPPPSALISRTLASNRRRWISMAFRSLASSTVCAVMTWR
jgi:hypothetical protein